MASSNDELDPTTPRVLLFGHRGAGKSALIGALLQAGETQGETLRGEVVHSSVELPRIRDAVYSGSQLEPSRQELVSYTIRLRPWRVGNKPVGEPLTVILDDCDGRAAEALLVNPEPIARQQPDSPLARAVVEADALILLVDASSTNDELKEAFQEFDTFLKIIRRAKTEARVVGGFPIFLVLTQCDRLARPIDTMSSWETRVRDRAEEAWSAFDAFIRDADPEDVNRSPFLEFGSLDLSVMAVAVRRPPLTGAPKPANQPFHVAELFRDCFAEARAHHDRVRQSEKRLRWTVRLALAALLLLFSTLAMVSLFPPHATGPTLAEKIRHYARVEPPPAVRLANDQIERYKTALRGFISDPAYPQLDADLRAFVEGRLKEIEDYEEYRRKLANALPPSTARNLPELRKLCAALQNELAPPPQYAWEGTPAAELRGKWIADCAAIEAAVKTLAERYQTYARQGTIRLLTRTFDASWLNDVAQFLTQTAKPPYPLNEPIPGSPAINHPRGEAVTYRVPYEFDDVVYPERRLWEQTRDRLLNLRDLADALGATTGPNRPPPVLVLPEPNSVDSAALPGERLTALKQTYPRPSEDYSEWEVSRFHEPARSLLAARLKQAFDIGVQHVQKLMKVEDTKEGWKALAARLSEPAFRDWGRLLHLLARLRESNAPDPVAELANFLRDLDTKPFTLDLHGFDLVIPLDFTIGLDRIEPTGPLTVTVSRDQLLRSTAKFTVGKGEIGENATTYRLMPEGTGKLTYFAGDELRAELPVKAGNQMFKLVWNRGTSDTFQFDRLTREPRLVKPNGTTQPAPGVTLTPFAASVIPKLPVLVPTK